MPRRDGPVVWAVASGKGGVGKSVVSSSLAIGLAATGPRTAIVDFDLGGANLHSVFGCEHPRHTLADVLRGRATLQEALIDTTVPGLRLISGARAGLDVANPKHTQKLKILRGVRRLDAGHIVLDLGAGSSFNTLDAFVAADRRILVTTPEPTSVENAYHFLKAAFFRSLREIAREPEVRPVLESVLEGARRDGASPRELVEAASRVDPGVGARLRARVQAFQIDLVFNRSELAETREPGIEMAAATRAQLGANLRLAGSLQTDSCVRAAIERGVPVMQLFPSSAFSSEMRRTVDRLIEGEPISGSSDASAARPGRREASGTTQPAAPMPAFDGISPGRHLRACRELLGLALHRLHDRTRIRHHYLERIEAEQYDSLPPEFYLRAYVRQIADALDLPDGERIAACFVSRARECAPGSPPSPSAGVPGAQPASGRGGVATSRSAVPSPSELIPTLDFEPELGGARRSGTVSPRPVGKTVATAAEPLPGGDLPAPPPLSPRTRRWGRHPDR